MAYYPKSQIKTNLYTNGEEFTLSTTNEDYMGYYYEISNGDKFTGKRPNDGRNILLQSPFPKNEFGIDGPIATKNEIIILNESYESYPDIPDSNFQYLDPNSSTSRFIPSPIQSFPSQKDYDLGEFQRYFAKKNNQNLYLEIDKETCDQLKNKDPKIAFELYTAISLPWDLSGEQTQTYTTNKNIVILVEEKNKWYGFTQWFKDDFLKFYKNPDIQEDLFTDGTEFINRRTKLIYRGPYHIHPEKGPMVGAKHIQRKHDYLDPIQLAQDLIVDPTPIPTPTYSGGGGSISSGGGGYSSGGGGY